MSQDPVALIDAPNHWETATLDEIAVIVRGVSFPKTAKAFCPLTEAPSSVATDQLDDLYLKLTLPEA